VGDFFEALINVKCATRYAAPHVFPNETKVYLFCPIVLIPLRCHDALGVELATARIRSVAVLLSLFAGHQRPFSESLATRKPGWILPGLLRSVSLSPGKMSSV
jgi:hypothetical protein